MRSDHSANYRVIAAFSLATLVMGCVATFLGVLAPTGRLGQPDETRWVQYFVTYKRFWNLPVEFYVSALAALLFIARRSAWRLIYSIALLSFGIGFLQVFPRNIAVWLVALCGLGAVLAAGSIIRGGVGDLVAKLKEEAMPPWTTGTVLSVLAITLTGALIHAEMLKNASLEGANARLLAWYDAARATMAPQSGINLTLFSDYQCPFCSVLIPQFEASAHAASANTVRITIRDFPLDSSCNDQIPLNATAPHPVACEAAAAARWVLSTKPELAESFRGWLYSKQAALTRELIHQQMKSLGVLDNFPAAYPELLEGIRADVKEGAKYGVNSTPSAVLNGVRLPSLSPLGLESLIRHELSKASARGPAPEV